MGVGALAGVGMVLHGAGVGVVASEDMGWALAKLYRLNAAASNSTSVSQQSSQSNAAKNGENSATKRGRSAHDSYNPGDKYTVDRRSNKLENDKIPDAVSIKGNRGIVRELKPNNPRKIREGTNQVNKYLKQLKKQYPNVKWNWAIDTYTENVDGTFNYQYDGLNK